MYHPGQYARWRPRHIVPDGTRSLSPCIGRSSETFWADAGDAVLADRSWVIL